MDYLPVLEVRGPTRSHWSNRAPAGLSPLPEAPGAVPLLFAAPGATHVPQPRAPSSTSDTSLSHLLLTIRPDFSFPSDSDTLSVVRTLVNTG